MIYTMDADGEKLDRCASRMILGWCSSRSPGQVRTRRWSSRF